MNKRGEKPLIIIGAGGHASVLIDILLKQNRFIEAIVTPKGTKNKRLFSDFQILKEDSDILNYSEKEFNLVNGIGFMPYKNIRKTINDRFISMGYEFETIIANTAEVSQNAYIESGAQILNGAIVQAGSTISNNTIVNTKSLIEHDCFIGKSNHIAPNSTLCGGVRTGDNVFIGASSTVVNGINIDNNCVIGAGSLIRKNIPKNITVYNQQNTISLGK